jgi:hypothetical protein
MRARHSGIRALLFVATALCCGSAGHAVEQYVPPEGGEPWLVGKVYLLATEAAPEARGAAAIMWTQDGTHHRFQLYAKQLEPRAEYSVWLLKPTDTAAEPGVEQRFRLTTLRTRLIADDQGVVAFAASLNFAMQDHFAAIVVRTQAQGSLWGWSGGVTVLRGLLSDMD